MQHNDCRISSNPVLIPPHQVVDGLLPMSHLKLFFYLVCLLLVKLILHTSLHGGFLFGLFPAFQLSHMLCMEVLLGSLLLTLFLNFKSNFDNVEPKVRIFWLLRLLNHCSQVGEVLFICLEIVHHSPLWRHFGLFEAADSRIEFTCLHCRHILQRVGFRRVDEHWLDFDIGSLS